MYTMYGNYSVDDANIFTMLFINIANITAAVHNMRRRVQEWGKRQSHVSGVRSNTTILNLRLFSEQIVYATPTLEIG